MRNRHNMFAAGGLAALALGVVACGGSAPRTRYYAVNYEAASSALPPRAGSQVGVALPQANHLLRQDRIVYFTSQNELNFYHYDRWAESPPLMVRLLLIHQLRKAGPFDNVVAYRAQNDLDYLLRGHLLAMEEVDTPTDISARFALELELVRQEGEQVVWSGRHSCQRPVATRTVAAVVATMSGCVEETLNTLTRSMGEAVSELERAAEKAKGE